MRTVMKRIEESGQWLRQALAPEEKPSKPYQAQKLRSRRKLDLELREAAQGV